MNIIETFYYMCQRSDPKTDFGKRKLAQKTKKKEERESKLM